MRHHPPRAQPAACRCRAAARCGTRYRTTSRCCRRLTTRRRLHRRRSTAAAERRRAAAAADRCRAATGAERRRAAAAADRRRAATATGRRLAAAAVIRRLTAPEAAALRRDPPPAGRPRAKRPRIDPDRPSAQEPPPPRIGASAEPSSSSTPTTRLDACAAALPARLPPASRTPTPAFLRRHRYVASLLYGIRSYVGSAGTSTGPLAPLCVCVDSAVHTTLGSTVGGVAPSCFVPVARA